MMKLIFSLIAALVVCAVWPAAAQQSTDFMAENMLVYQRSYGGWPKAVDNAKVDYHKSLSKEERAAQRSHLNDQDATIDNNATTREIVHLMKAYTLTKNSSYLEAAKRGIDYLL